VHFFWLAKSGLRNSAVGAELILSQFVYHSRSVCRFLESMLRRMNLSMLEIKGESILGNLCNSFREGPILSKETKFKRIHGAC
jgi:hypothetical protein